MNQVRLEGNCKAPIELQIQATLKAPPNPSQLKKDMEWLTINHIDHFTLSGGGIFDGQGEQGWAQNDCKNSESCGKLLNVSHILSTFSRPVLYDRNHYLKNIRIF